MGGRSLSVSWPLLRAQKFLIIHVDFHFLYYIIQLSRTKSKGLSLLKNHKLLIPKTLCRIIGIRGYHDS